MESLHCCTSLCWHKDDMKTVTLHGDTTKLPYLMWIQILTHWDRVTHICVNKPAIIGSDNGLSPGRRQAIIWTSAVMFLFGPLETNFSDNLIEILTFSFTKMRLNVSSAKWWPFCLGLNVLDSLFADTVIDKVWSRVCINVHYATRKILLHMKNSPSWLDTNTNWCECIEV